MHPTRLTLISALLTLLATPTLAESSYGRSYPTPILNPDAAEAIVWAECEAAKPEVCQVINVSRSDIAVTTNASTHARISAALAEAQRIPGAQVFQLTMIEAENNGDRGLGNIPQPAREALEDARAFLPFNGYKLLGTALLRTDENASALVNGPGGAEYNCEIGFRHEITRDGRRLDVRRFSLGRMPPKQENGQYVAGSSTIEVLNTSFGMKPGETVVVGTSRLEGANRALVVLLTALE